MTYQCTQCGQEITEQEYRENDGICFDVIGCWEKINSRENIY